MWACLDSNQGPLPYQRSVTVFWGFPQFTNILQIAVFLDRSSSRHFRRFTRVAARLLHRCDGLHPHKVRDDRYSPSRLEPPYASFVLGAFPAVSSRCRRLQRAKRVRIAYPTARNAQVAVKIRVCDMHPQPRGDMICSLVTGRRSPPFLFRLTKEICKEQDDERTDTINGRVTPTS